MSIIFTVHLLSASLWVGGMFFAYFALRPVAASLLEPPLRLSLWQQSLSRFFSWVWGFALLLPTTGYSMIFSLYGGMAHAPVEVHIMQLLGLTMLIIFAHAYFSPYKKLSLYINEGKLPDAAKCLNMLRRLIAINLALGILTIVIASSIRF